VVEDKAPCAAAVALAVVAIVEEKAVAAVLEVAQDRALDRATKPYRTFSVVVVVADDVASAASCSGVEYETDQEVVVQKWVGQKV
jgi:hypothetical protein